MSKTEGAKILDVELADGLENLIAQMGTEKDKRAQSTYVNNKRLSANGNEEELDALYRTSWVAGKVVDIIPDDMTREWRTFDGDITPEQIADLEAEEDRLALSFKFNQAHKWARLYGTAYIVMSVDDGNTPDKPLEIDKIKPGALRHINVVDRHRIDNSEVVPIADPMNANFGMPEFYRIRETSIKIHHTRLLRFDGVRLPFDEFRRNNYNSDSVLDRLYESITNLDTTANASSSMVYETNVDIVKVKGLMTYLQTAEGESTIRKRFALAKLLKSFNNMMLIDAEEEATNKTNTFSGLPDLLDRFALYVAGASDIPATRLLGSAASGLNATGEGDLKNYYDTVKSNQKTEYKPLLDTFDMIMARNLGMSEDSDLSYDFNSLFQMTPKEKSDMEFVDSQRDEKYYNMGVVTEAMIAKDLQQNQTYTNIDDQFIKELEGLEDVDTDTDDLELISESENENGEEKESESSQNTEDS